MTVSTTQNRVVYYGDNVTTLFQPSILAIQDTDVVIYKDGVMLVKGSSYNISLSSLTGAPYSPTIVLYTPLAIGSTLTIYTDCPLLQSTDLPTNGIFPSSSVELLSDKLTMIAQRLRNLIDRSIRLPDSDASGASVLLPAAQANSVFGWNNTKSAIINYVLTTVFPTNLPQSVTNVAELRTTVPLYPNQQFNLLGYTTAGKGGGRFVGNTVVST